MSLRTAVPFSRAAPFIRVFLVIDIAWKARSLRLDPGTTKNGDGRSFPFTARSKRSSRNSSRFTTLKKAGTICPFVFHRDGECIAYFRAAWKSACKVAGCPGALVHDMRRSAVRTFERAGVPRSVAMSIVGHKKGVDLSPVRHRG